MSDTQSPPVVARAQRPRSWAQPPDVDEPIVDAARVPFAQYRSTQAPGWSAMRKRLTFAWLKLLRPLLTAGACIGGAFYAWPHLHTAHVQPGTQRLLWLYAAIVGAIFCCMLLVALFRRMTQRAPSAVRQDGSSLAALADYIEVPAAQLGLCQQAKLLFVQHNAHGRLRAATAAAPDTLPAPAPLLTAA